MSKGMGVQTSKVLVLQPIRDTARDVHLQPAAGQVSGPESVIAHDASTHPDPLSPVSDKQGANHRPARRPGLSGSAVSHASKPAHTVHSPSMSNSSSVGGLSFPFQGSLTLTWQVEQARQ
jgi:hypothetical protein